MGVGRLVQSCYAIGAHQVRVPSCLKHGHGNEGEYAWLEDAGGVDVKVKHGDDGEEEEEDEERGEYGRKVIGKTSMTFVG